MTSYLAHPVYRALAAGKSAIAYDDAVQLFLWLYCTLDVLPASFPDVELPTETLVKIFEHLTAAGLVAIPERRSLHDGNPVDWAVLPDTFLSGSVQLDEDFREKIEGFFQLHVRST